MEQKLSLRNRKTWYFLTYKLIYKPLIYKWVKTRLYVNTFSLYEQKMCTWILLRLINHIGSRFFYVIAVFCLTDKKPYLQNSLF